MNYLSKKEFLSIRLFRATFVCLLFLCKSHICFAQDEDVVSWNQFHFSKKIDDKITAHFKPIYRRNNNQEYYLNTSIDVFLTYKANPTWSFKALHRHWFIPDRGDRRFIFLDATYHFPAWGKFRLKNTFRYHLAFDTNQFDGDFFRIQPHLSYQLGKGWSILIMQQYFFQFNDREEFTRIRSIAGFDKKINDRFGFGFQYWREAFINQETNFQLHILAPTLSYKF